MAFRDYTKADQRPVRVVNDADYPIPDDAMNAIMELQAYNFTYLGAMEFASYVRRKPHQEWVLVHQDRNIILQLSDVMSASKGMLFQFASAFEDGARVETYLPGRGRIEKPNYRFQKVKGSLSEALDIHQREITDFFFDHGAPLKFYTIDDVVEQERICNIHHAKTRLRPSIIQLAYTTGWMILFTIMVGSVGFDLAGDVVPLILVPFVLLGGLPMIWWDRGN
jgi:hypothetical protein